MEVHPKGGNMKARSEGPVARLGRYESASRPGNFYDVWLGEDDVTYCECGAWRYQKGAQPHERKPCSHIRRARTGDRGVL